MKVNHFLIVRLSTVLLLLVVLTVVCISNVIYLPQGDDMVYGSVVKTSGEVGRLNTVLEVFDESFVADGYRPIAHFFTRLFCYKILGWFPIANTLMALFLLSLISLHATGTMFGSFGRIALLLFLYLLVLFTGETGVFIAGSCNYLWCAVVSLVFIISVKRLENGQISWRDLFWLCPLALIAGWWQESFALPIGFAIVCWTGLHCRKFTFQKVLVYGLFATGFLLFVLGNSRMSRSDNPVKFFSDVTSVVKFVWGAKAVDIAVLLFVFSADKKSFIRRNAFDWLIIIGSAIMVVLLGYYGDRMVYIANVCGIMITVREFTPVGGLPVCFAGLTLVLSMVVLWVNKLAALNSEESVRTYKQSADGVYCMEKIGYPLWRYCFQDFPSWGECYSVHKICFSAYYCGVTNKIPIGLEHKLFEHLYKEDTFCVPNNRLNISTEAYTTPDVNAIVLPIRSQAGTKLKDCQVRVCYTPVHGIKERLLEKWNQWHYVEIQHPTPVLLDTPHGRYLLVGKKRMSENRIIGIEFYRLAKRDK